MAEWKRLSGGEWGVQTRSGRTGETVTVTRANGTTSRVTLGSLVKRTRWGRVFAVAGRTAPARPRTAPVRRRRARRDPGVVNPGAILHNLRASVRQTTAPVAEPEAVDPSVARFRLLDLSDEPTERAPEPVDDGPGRVPMID